MVEKVTISGTVIDTFIATWDVDGRTYMWIIYEDVLGERSIIRMYV